MVSQSAYKGKQFQLTLLYTLPSTCFGANKFNYGAFSFLNKNMYACHNLQRKYFRTLTHDSSTSLIYIIFSDNETTVILAKDSSLAAVEDQTKASTVRSLVLLTTGTPNTTRAPQATTTVSAVSDNLSTTAAGVISYTEPKRYGHSRTYVLPPYNPPPDARWGPFFEEGPEPHNVTARVGSKVVLDCRIGLLHDKMVSNLC